MDLKIFIYIYIYNFVHFVVDRGFANPHSFLAPFHGIHYHLQDFVSRVRDPKRAVELFNLRHASLRNVITRIFNWYIQISFSNFQVCSSIPIYDTNKS